jgi:hypothetical protein
VPAEPTVPTVPTVPPVPAEPTVPTLPTVPAEPTLPTLPVEATRTAAPSAPRPPLQRSVEPAPRRSRAWLWGALAALISLVVGAAGGAVAGASLAADQRPASPTPSATIASGPRLPSPLRPATEPPNGVAWPASWPRFAAAESVKDPSLDGIGFAFVLPSDWACQPGDLRADIASYVCGISTDGQLVIGGDIQVFGCPAPCDAERWREVRTSVEAWGLRWSHSGNFMYWAQTDSLDGAPRYGLVFVTFWRSAQENALDRVLVFRMTAPVKQADTLRKVANGLRDAISRWEF